MIDHASSGHVALEAMEPLRSGDVLDQPTFHRRYEAMPDGFNAELIDAIVYVHGRITYAHATLSATVHYWLGCYSMHTPGTCGMARPTVILDHSNEPQPDAGLRIEQEHGGHSWIGPDDYICGSPELFVEIAYSSESIDLHQKRRAYERAGVQEYVVVLIRESAVRFFRLEQHAYHEVSADADGIWRSSVFPGLWLNVRALLDRDGLALLETVQRGIGSEAHQQFVAQLHSSMA